MIATLLFVAFLAMMFVGVPIGAALGLAGAAAIALRGAKILTPVVITVNPTSLTKAEPWYRIPKRRMHFSFRVGADIDPQTFAVLGPPPKASRLLNDFVHDYFIKELAIDERSET